MKKGLLVVLFLFGFSQWVQAQQKVISGTVKDAKGNAIPGVNIFIQNTTTGTISDFEGHYSLSVPQDAPVLVFSYIGYTKVEENIDDRTIIDVVMQEDTKQLQEIVVTGYSTQKRADIVGSISSVNPQAVKDMPITGLDQALQGQVSGVTVTKSSGEPGGGIMVRIRGNSSIASSNRPLYVIDGIPVRDGGLTQRSFGGQNDNALATLNPNDIASIEVLKDAAAKAIYGSRAANGVVLITTKRGKANTGTTFDIDVQRGLSQPTGKIDLLNSKELLQLQREAMVNAGEDPNSAGIPGVTDGVNTDWVDAVTRQALMQQYQLSATGGSENTRFYLSGSYRDEEGVMLNNEFKRFTTTANIDHDATDRLTFGLNLSLARILNKRVKGDNFLDGVYSAALSSLPYYQPYDEEGNLYAPGDNGYASFPNFNPVAQALEPRFDTYATRILGGIDARYEIIPKLFFTSKVSIDYTTTVEDQYEPTTTAIGGYLVNVGQQGYGVYSTSEAGTLVNNNVFNYNTSIGDVHVIGITVGTEFIKRLGRSSSVTGILFPSNDFTYITSAGIVNQGSSDMVESGLMSFFSEVNYKYKEKYLAKASVRYDGSSRFGQGKKYGFFPAISLGYRISQESFLKKYNFIDDIKLRASYGLTGNERIGDFQYLGTWAAVTAYNGIPAIAPATLENPDLGWEQTAEFNLGSDLSFLAGRIQIVFDYYYNVTSDLLLSESLPYTTGFGSVTGNLGEVTNEGLEFTLNTVNVDKALKWTTQLNLSRNRNEVVKLATEEPQFAGYQTFTNSTHIIDARSAIGIFLGFEISGSGSCNR